MRIYDHKHWLTDGVVIRDGEVINGYAHRAGIRHAWVAGSISRGPLESLLGMSEDERYSANAMAFGYFKP